MIELNQLEQLIYIAENKTISKAAKELLISQPALSRSMQRLESDLGVELFDHYKNKIVLNKNGELAVKHAQKIIKSIQTMINDVQDYDQSFHRISIATCSPAPMWDIEPLIKELYPQITIQTAVINKKDLLTKLKEKEYQLVILDVMMPGMDGFETLEEIRKENSLPILMFTSKNDSASKVRGLRAGADDYLTKPFDMDELIARIVSLIRRYTRFNGQDGTPQQLDFDGLKIDLENRSITTVNGTFELPPKEFDLLLFCAKNQGKILTKQRIYEEVWGEEYFYDDSNIMAIISRLRKKIEANPGSPKYIQTIKGIGYRFNKEV